MHSTFYITLFFIQFAMFITEKMWTVSEIFVFNPHLFSWVLALVTRVLTFCPKLIYSNFCPLDKNSVVWRDSEEYKNELLAFIGLWVSCFMDIKKWLT
jgi:hypothetical protein